MEITFLFLNQFAKKVLNRCNIYINKKSFINTFLYQKLIIYIGCESLGTNFFKCFIALIASLLKNKNEYEIQSCRRKKNIKYYVSSCPFPFLSNFLKIDRAVESPTDPRFKRWAQRIKSWNNCKAFLLFFL